MGRWAAILFGITLAAGVGLLAGYVRWGTQATHIERVEERLQATTSELTSLREQKQQLEEKVEQVSKEQERLAQENEILRQQHTTEQLVGGQGGELPERPPK